MRYSYAAPKEVPVDRAMADTLSPEPIVSAVIYPDIKGVIFVRIGTEENNKCAVCGERFREHGSVVGNGPRPCMSPSSVPGDSFVRDGVADVWAVYNPFMRQAVSRRFTTVIDARNWTIVYLCKPTVRGGAHQTRESL